MDDHGDQATFRSMDTSTAEDWQAIGSHFMPFAGALADRVLTHLRLLDGDYGGFPIDRLQHSLQTATRAHRGGEDERYVVMALLHDIGDLLAPENHSELAAAILRPYVAEDNYWLVKHHGIFQGYYFFHHIGLDRDEREQYRGHPMFERTALFCEKWDQNSFDPAYDTAPIETFEPMVRRLFDKPPFGRVRTA